MVKVGMDLWKSSDPNLLFKQGLLGQVAMTRQLLHISTGEDSTTSLGNLFQCSVTLTLKKFFHTLVWNFLCSSFRPLLLVLLLHITKKNLASSICLPSPFRYLQTLIRSPPSLLFPRLNRLLSISSYERCSMLFIVFVVLRWTPRRSLSSWNWGVQNWTQ